MPFALFFETGSLTEPEACPLTTPAGQQAPEILLSFSAWMVLGSRPGLLLGLWGKWGSELSSWVWVASPQDLL